MISKRRVLKGGAVLFAVAVLVGCSSGDSGSADGGSGDDGPLVVASWGNNFAAATEEYLVAPFAEEAGVEYAFQNSPGEQAALIRQMVQSGNVEWDTVDSLNPEAAFSLYADGMAAEIPDDVRAELLEVIPEEAISSHGIYFSASGFVIGCNENLLDECPQTMADMWDFEKFPGERAMIDRPLIALTAALVADGVPEDEMFPMDLDRAFAKLEELKPHVRTWYSSGDQYLQLVTEDQVSTGLWWSGRTMQLIEDGSHPVSMSWDGAIYEPAQSFVVKDAPHEELAWDYLVHVAGNAQGEADWASTLFYGIPNLDAWDLMDDDTAQGIPDYPANKEQMVTPDYEWYAENREEVERRWVEFLSS